jgi:glycosyltransferase involved in cell wall biosynthesis
MRIALFVSSWPPGSQANGIVTYAAQIVPALRQLGHDVFLITLNKRDDDPRTIDLRGFFPRPTVISRIYARINFDMATITAIGVALGDAIQASLARYNLDVFEIEESFGWSFIVSSRRLLPLVVRLHGPWFLNGRFDETDFGSASSRRRRRSEARAIRNSSFVSSPSAIVLENVKQHYNISLPNSAVVANPLDAAPQQACWSVKRVEVNSLLFIGRFDKRKGGDLVLRVFCNIAQDYPELRLTVVGPDNGLKVDDGRLLRFESFVREFVPAGIRSRITFRGQLNHDELIPLRTRHFITIVASQYEIMPYAVLEPMAYGCPIVATDVGGISELIRDHQNGLLVPTQDVDKMTDACKLLLNDRSLAARLGRQAWVDCRDLYGTQRVAKQTIAAYEAAMNAFRQERSSVERTATGSQP